MSFFLGKKIDSVVAFMTTESINSGYCNKRVIITRKFISQALLYLCFYVLAPFNVVKKIYTLFVYMFPLLLISCIKLYCTIEYSKVIILQMNKKISKLLHSVI